MQVFHPLLYKVNFRLAQLCRVFTDLVTDVCTYIQNVKLDICWKVLYQ